MKILLIHNSYLEPGGEDEVVQTERALLEKNGHMVIPYLRHNREIEGFNFAEKVNFFLNEAVYSERSYRDIKELVQAHRPDLAHIHNTFYVISPSIYQALHEEGVPIVQSLHNYRPLLTEKSNDYFPEFQASIYNLKKFMLRYGLLPRVLQGMAKGRIFERTVTKFICHTQFSKDIFVRHGFEREKIEVVAPSVCVESCDRNNVGSYCLFVGRLAEYKGVEVLLNAMKLLPACHLRIIGDGPTTGIVRQAVRVHKNIDYLGRLPQQETLAEIKKCAFLVFPSLCYETFGKVMIEAFACGVPVLGSRNTTAEEIIEDGMSGLLFNSHDENDLADKMKRLFNDPQLVQSMGERAREVYELKYTLSRNYAQLMTLYQKALREKKHEESDQVV